MEAAQRDAHGLLLQHVFLLREGREHVVEIDAERLIGNWNGPAGDAGVSLMAVLRDVIEVKAELAIAVRTNSFGHRAGDRNRERIDTAPISCEQWRRIATGLEHVDQLV